MSTTLTADTDLDALIERLGVGPDEELRSSTRRENHLDTYAKIMSGDWGVTLSLCENSAHIEMADGENRIKIPTKELDQPATDLPRNVYDLLGQETLTLHEVGHYRYSDWPSMDDLKEDLDEYLKNNTDVDGKQAKAYQSAFQIVWNAIEDGCIERFLKIEFRCESEFDVINENLSTANNFGKVHSRGDQERQIYTMLQAVLLALMDIGHHDSGDLKRLLDPDDNEHTITTTEDDQRFRDFLPRIKSVLADAQSEADAVGRNHVVYDFFLDMVDLLEAADTSGLRRVQGEQDHSPMQGKPDDAHEGIGEAKADMDADAKADMDADAMPDSPDDAAATVPKPGDDDDDAGGAGADQDDDGDGSSGGADLEEEVQQEYQKALRDEAKDLDGGESLVDEMEEFQGILKGAGPGDTKGELIIPEPGEVDLDRWHDARAEAMRLKTILEDSLRESRYDQWRRGVQSGKFDRNRMIPAARGDPRACKRPRQGKQKDYSCVLVVDRSGSMSRSIEDTEFATGALSHALEGLGVDTMILDFVGGKTRLAKPFGQSTESSKDTIFTGVSGGGTPLSDASYLSRMRVNNGIGTNPFVIVITDGEAHDMNAYREEIDRCNFPVIGVYLRDGVSRKQNPEKISRLESEMAPFNRWTIVASDDSLSLVLRQLANEVIL